VIHEIRVVGSRCGPFPPALRALETGGIDVRPMITDRFPLDRAIEAVQRASEPDALKVLLEP
jgi:threonine dehydrogenase-like Zn-dependent dehydrogenase